MQTFIRIISASMFVAVFFTALVFGVSAGFLSAQTPRGIRPPWGQGQPMQGQPTQRNNRNADRTARMMQMFRSMDVNQNGILEPGEISDTRREFVLAITARLGADSNRPINLTDLERRAALNSPGNRNDNRNNDRDNRNRGNSERIRNSTEKTSSAEPLVPKFGEQQPASTPVLAFGQRENVSVPVIINSSNQADLVSRLSGPATPTARQSTQYAHIPADVKENTSLDWFFSCDKDLDGQLTMQEYVGGYDGNWTPAIAAEFRFLDRNGDGFSTIDEVLLTLKEVDEQRAATTPSGPEEKTPPSERITPPALGTPPGTAPAGITPLGNVPPDSSQENSVKNKTINDRANLSRNRQTVYARNR